jgi:hypothetical protein
MKSKLENLSQHGSLYHGFWIILDIHWLKSQIHHHQLRRKLTQRPLVKKRKQSISSRKRSRSRKKQKLLLRLQRLSRKKKNIEQEEKLPSLLEKILKH